VSWRGQIEQWKREDTELAERQANAPADPINPLRVIRELDRRLPDGAILTGDSGTSAYWLGRDIALRRGMMASVSGGLATMGCGVPYALAAKLAHPSRPVIALVGDGAMQMNGLNELITVAKYWQRWADPRFVVLVLNNRDLNMVSWEQRIMQGEPKFADSQDLPDFPYAAYADLLGLRGLTVDEPSAVGTALDLALASERPVVLEAVVDPAVPMLPPHITLEQARGYLKAILKGDPESLRIVKQAMKEVLA
jgi:pyruvate dehydrogenase (quinone)